MPGPTLAIDFGTSNSAAAILEDGAPRRLALEPGAETLPTAVFFPANRGPMRIGAAAASALIDGEEGRYMRALKTVLGTALLHESRLIGGKRRSLAEVITEFLIEIRKRAEAASGARFTSVLSGRPPTRPETLRPRPTCAPATMRPGSTPWRSSLNPKPPHWPITRRPAMPLRARKPA